MKAKPHGQKPQLRKLKADGRTFYRVNRTLFGKATMPPACGAKVACPIFIHILEAADDAGTSCSFFSLS